MPEPPRRRRKWIVAGLSALLALVVVKLVGLPGAAPHRAAAPTEGGGTASTGVVDEALVRDQWGQMKGYRYDPLALLMREPDTKQRWKLPEYPGGVFLQVTNDRGFREDQPTPQEFGGARVVVSGDSHTDGMVENPRSFANVAEAELTRALGEPVDVINAGVGSTSPRCYLGMLRKCLELGPDVFVAVLFTGNDFVDDLALAYRLGTRRKVACPQLPKELLEQVGKEFGGFFQGLHQAYRFRSCPEEADIALTVVLESVFAMDELCRREGIDFLLVLLPSKTDVEDDDREAFLAACRRLGLEESDAALDLQLGRKVLEAARERGIECLDPTDAMRASQVPLYWKGDHHLAIAGHALLGSLLSERLRELIARRHPAGAR